MVISGKVGLSLDSLGLFPNEKYLDYPFPCKCISSLMTKHIHRSLIRRFVLSVVVYAFNLLNLQFQMQLIIKSFLSLSQ